MPTVVVTGSNNDFRFGVTDFSNAKAPTTVFVNPGFSSGPSPTGNGCVVSCSSLFSDGDISGTLVAVGNYGGGQVAIYDLSNPALPQLQSTFDTRLGGPGLTGIGALSLYGDYLLVGEARGPNIVLLNISPTQSSNPIISTKSFPDFAGDGTNGGITSIAIHGSIAVASGLFAFDFLDYTDPTNPVQIPFTPPSQYQFNPPYTCDYNDVAALGDSSGTVTVFSVSPEEGASIIGQMSNVVFGGVTSISIQSNQSGDAILVAAGCISSNVVHLLTFGVPAPAPPPPSEIATIGNASGANPGGAVAFYGSPNLFCSTNNGQGVTWLGTASPLPVVGVAANANLAQASISTLGVAYFRYWFWWIPPWVWWLFGR
jgi:hypothetical protein